MNFWEMLTATFALWGFWQGMRLMTRTGRWRRVAYRSRTVEPGTRLTYTVPPFYILWLGGLVVASVEVSILVGVILDIPWIPWWWER